MPAFARWIGLAAIALAVTAGAAASQPAAAAGCLLVVQGDVVAADGNRMVVAVGPTALAFTDRPGRSVRFVDVASMVATEWGPGGEFRAVPPNAALVDAADGTVAIIEIRDAVWANGAITMTVAVLEGVLPPAGARIAVTIDVVHPTQY